MDHRQLLNKVEMFIEHQCDVGFGLSDAEVRVGYLYLFLNSSFRELFLQNMSIYTYYLMWSPLNLHMVELQ